MTNQKNSQVFHSGKRLQKLRELQGLSISELAAELAIESPMLMKWEKDGIPDEFIKQCSYYFEVSTSMFSAPVNNQFELERLARAHLFSQNDNSLVARLEFNKKNQEAMLDLSGLGLSEIPFEIFEFSWLTHLNLSDNQLKSLPSRIILLQQLETLDISKNLLQQIPGIICALKNLKQLNFQDNPLTLQSFLLHSSMTLDAYQAYLSNTNMSVVILERFTTKSLECLDKIRNTVEQTQSLVISETFIGKDLAAKYKRIFSLLYIVENSNPDYLTIKIKPLLLEQIYPLLIIFIDTLTDLQSSVVNSRLNALSSKSSFLLKFVEDKDDFPTVFNDIQRRLTYQERLPYVRFENLSLNNIGVYENLNIALNSDLTVLIGLNGTGKTTILKALALAVLGPEQAEVDSNTAANLLRIIGKEDNCTHWQPQGRISLRASVNGKSYENIIHLVYNSNNEKVEIKGRRFDALFNSDGSLINLMLGIGEQRITSLKKPQSLGLEVPQPKAKDLLPIISGGVEQACIAYFSSWLGNLALAASQGEIEKQQDIEVSFSVFSSLMHEPIRFAGLTKVDPLELWVEHQSLGQIVPLRLVSQGYQAVMGWVGLIIQRMFEAYAEALQPLQQPAIIIIDEIDQLLHVKWQQKILSILTKEFFPNTQWIITTHSPMVVIGLDKEQVIHLHQRDGKIIAEPNAVDLWLWQYGDVVRHLFEVPSEKPELQEQQLKQDIEAIKSQPEELTATQLQELAKLEQRLEKVQKSRAFIDEIYAEQKKLHAKEQELATLIEQLKQN